MKSKTDKNGVADVRKCTMDSSFVQTHSYHYHVHEKRVNTRSIANSMPAGVFSVPTMRLKAQRYQ